VVAETLAIARDAAELVTIDYEALPAVVEAEEAAKPGAPLLWEQSRSNVFLEAEVGAAAATERAFAGAAHVVSFESWWQRVTGVPMEARTAAGNFDAQTGRYFLHAGSGGVVRQKGELAGILNVRSRPCMWSRAISAAISAPRTRCFRNSFWSCGPRSASGGR